MAKKSSAKMKKQPAKAAKPARPARRAAPPAVSAKSGAATPKYQQAGAPWWKQYLPR